MAFLIYCLVAMVSLSLASMSPAVSAVEPPTMSNTDQFLRAHNEARAAVGVPPLSWNSTLMMEALRYSSELRVDCDALPPAPWGTRGAYGRNLYHGHGVRRGADAAAFWAQGRRWYDVRGAANACAAPPGWGCGAYTQMVWRDTTQLACVARPCRCARRPCPDVIDTVAVCEYYPPGNLVGQRPY
ncbi:pathogenesis-related protein PRMS-like [Oryza brachyantha]|uniref:pathogenesis-related protein PRMS-like n=1 Tax=Oryza brachyantha TaxID=4533 RepID=UPI001AD9F126|nr:pathogenesis-related protein PRMS-like [Oryza brachyantha]